MLDLGFVSVGILQKMSSFNLPYSLNIAPNKIKIFNKKSEKTNGLGKSSTNWFIIIKLPKTEPLEIASSFSQLKPNIIYDSIILFNLFIINLFLIVFILNIEKIYAIILV